MAAVAVAGLLVYVGMSGGKKKKSKDSSASKQKTVTAAPAEETKEQRKDTEPDAELENHFFIDPTKTPEEANEIIMKWMNDQVEALLGQYVPAKLPVSESKLTEDDFFRIMQIVNCR